MQRSTAAARLRPSPFGTTTLETMMACAKLLLETASEGEEANATGASPSADTSELDAELLRAAEGGDLARVRALLDQGADVHTTDADGYGALHLAVKLESVRRHAQRNPGVRCRF